MSSADSYSGLPSLNALRAFDAAAREVSISRAADSLHVTHGAVSRQIRQLEAQLGVQLFARVGRGIELTPQGQQLYVTTREVFSQLQRSCDQLRHQASHAPFVLACSGSFLARWFIPRLDRLRQECPQLELHLTASEDQQALRPGIDAALRFAEPPWPQGVQVLELAAERIGPVLSPELADLPPPPAAEALLGLPLLHTLSRPQAWPAWFRAQGLDSSQLRRDQSFEHLNYMLEAALVGLGVAIAPAYLVEEDLRTGRLIAPWGFIETRARLSLWLPAQSASGKAQQLADWLRRELHSESIV